MPQSFTDTAPNFRGVERLVRGTPTSDGAGVKLTRVLTQDLQHRLDPFLMLDNFASENRTLLAFGTEFTLFILI